MPAVRAKLKLITLTLGAESANAGVMDGSVKTKSSKLWNLSGPSL
jgi:hypothetical protein